jgi:hypothetical protein
MKIQHTPSSFYSIPDRFITPLRSANNKKLRILIQFNEQSRYKRPQIEKDWLKATGVSFNPIWDARNNSIMAAYRYVEEVDYWEITPYYHDKTRKYYNADFNDHLAVTRLGLGETATIDIDWSGAVPTFSIEVYDFNKGVQVVPKRTFECKEVEPTRQNRLISSYAGGDEKIPTPFSYTREIIL